ncbi:hypothetical protein Vadar_031152 [Vaccinium darrowii]|uniref:Uncharacterized protein n=1 Tax=Vaccinium darrowii TaxID=229202 RepID=A0ACB7XW26_9ERIC|nr:hypothetical protein Vadar_031152 [Vaccinium darrowii]
MKVLGKKHLPLILVHEMDWFLPLSKSTLTMRYRSKRKPIPQFISRSPVCLGRTQLGAVGPFRFGTQARTGVIVHEPGWGTDFLEVQVAFEQDFHRAPIIFKVHLIVSKGRTQSQRGRNGVILYENSLPLRLGIRIFGPAA